MSEVLQHILDAIPLVLQPDVILFMVIGTAVGIAIGALPGLSATMGIAVLIPLTFAMTPLAALGMIAGIYNGARRRDPGDPAAHPGHSCRYRHRLRRLSHGAAGQGAGRPQHLACLVGDRQRGQRGGAPPARAAACGYLAQLRAERVLLAGRFWPDLDRGAAE